MLSSCARLVPAAAATAASAARHPPAGPSLQTRAAAKSLVAAGNAATAGTQVLTIAVPPTPAELTSAVLIAVVPAKGLAAAAPVAAVFIGPPLAAANAAASEAVA